MNNNILIDVVTFSSVSKEICGDYKYLEAPDYELLVLGYQDINTDRPNIVDLACGDEIPLDVCFQLMSPNITKYAINAEFVMEVLSKYGLTIDPSQWVDVTSWNNYQARPFKLIFSAERYRRTFTEVADPKIYGKYKVEPSEHKEEWGEFLYDYKLTVNAIAMDCKKMCNIPLPNFERTLFKLNYKINQAGVLVDKRFIDAAMEMYETEYNKLFDELVSITHVKNPGSVKQILEWIYRATGEQYSSLNSSTFDFIMLRNMNNPIVRDVLVKHKQLARISIKKYETMVECMNLDGRVRGMFVYYGAATGRWSSKLVQLQNLPKNKLKSIDYARQMVIDKESSLIELIYGNINDVLSQLIRTAFVAPAGKVFAVADFSSIEARILAWITKEQWKLDIFRGKGNIYEETASRMFKVPIELVTKDSEYREKGKAAELLLGFGGGAKALERHNKKGVFRSEEDMEDVKTKWRKENLEIVAMWVEMENAFKDALTTKCNQKTPYCGVTVYYEPNLISISLPSSDRRLYYRYPKIKNGKLSYYGYDSVTHMDAYIHLYGGRIVENIIQAIARDLLGYAMINLDKAGYKIVMHIHDEFICEVPDVDSEKYLHYMLQLMKTPPEQMSDIPLNANGYLTPFYKKD